MSNIANQLVAVVATLLGFVAHDVLTERGTPAIAVASATSVAVDPVVTRSVDMTAISAEWIAGSLRAERAGQLRPATRVSGKTAATRPSPKSADAQFANIRLNDARVAAPGQRTAAFIR